MANWDTRGSVNDDGLIVRFGTDLAKTGGGGEFHWTGPFVQHEFDLDFSKFEPFGNVTVLDYTVRLQNGILLTSAEVEVVVPFTSSGTPTLDIGLVDKSNPTAASYDIDGIDAAIAMTAMDTVGETVTCDGALINTILANASDEKSLVAIRVNTANYTAGRAKLRFNYFVPTPYVNPVA